MRLQLAVLAVGAVIAQPARAALADGTLAARAVYYKERATRVEQPMLDAMFEVGTRGLLNAHFLVDAITSASASSGAANSQAFTEHRYEGGGGYTHQLDRFRIGGDAKYSTESDYRSFYAGARIEADLAQKNMVVGLGGGLGFDSIDNAGAQGPMMNGPLLACTNQATPSDHDCSLHLRTLNASVSQIVSRNAIVAATYDVSSLHGYQANPYRTAIAGDVLVAERHPLERLRQAFGLSARYFVHATETTLIGAYRYYRDDWKVIAHTPELRIVQQVGIDVDAAVRYRYYTQTAASFYQERYASADPSQFPFISDDVKLSQFTAHTFEAKLGVLGEAFDLEGRWAGTRFEGILEYVIQNNRFGNAIIAHLAVTVPFDY